LGLDLRSEMCVFSGCWMLGHCLWTMLDLVASNENLNFKARLSGLPVKLVVAVRFFAVKSST
jgi:stringent starvation protein B